MTDPEYWRKCSSCKKPIPFGSTFWVCNVSTCNRKRTGLVFCTVSCWDAHVPLMRHRDSWAEERIAPKRDAYLAQLAAQKDSSDSGESETLETSAAPQPRRIPKPSPAPQLQTKPAVAAPVIIRRSSQTSSTTVSGGAGATNVTSYTAIPSGPSANHSTHASSQAKEYDMNDETTTSSAEPTDPNKQEVLVVASKVKNYIRAKSGMNTSASVLDALSGKIRELCDQAIERAKTEGRKTVMDRDFG